MKYNIGNRIPAACRRQRGFSLIETIVALLLIGIVSISFFTALSSGFALVGMERDNLRATQVMLRKIEGIRLCTWSQLPASLSFAEFYNPKATTSTGRGTLYSGTVTTSPTGGVIGSLPYTDNTRLVTVTVWWTDSAGGQPVAHRRQMQTLVARYGMHNYLLGDQP